jgi:hypothetical protein
MKKLLFAAFVLTSSFSAMADDIKNEKVLDAFRKTFQNAQDVSWSTYSNVFEANFNVADIKLRISYDSEGNVTRTIRYYSGKMLPAYIQAKVGKSFAGKSVFGVTELTSENEVLYHIILEDEKTWTHVRSDAYGNLITERKLTKA